MRQEITPIIVRERIGVVTIIHGRCCVCLGARRREESGSTANGSRSSHRGAASTSR
jgi:hypothetical protein